MDTKRFKVDFHTHILPSDIPDFEAQFGYSGFIKFKQNDQDPEKLDMIKNNAHFRTIECNCHSPARRIEECNDSNVDVQVLSTVPVMFSYFAKPQDGLIVSKFLNDHIAKCIATDPKRFLGLGTVPMQDIGLAVGELKRCVTELGLNGIQIGTHINEHNLDSPIFYPLWEAAQELDTVIFVHPWDMQMTGRMSKFWFPWLIGMPTETTTSIASMVLGGVFERYPKLKVVFAHGGGSFLGTFGRICHGYDCRPDLVATDCKTHPKEFLKNLYFDSLVHDNDALKLMVSMVDTKNILLGTDYPFPLGEQVPGKLVEDADWLPESDKRRILGLNALDIFNLDITRFQ
ncbi:hypothetical protein BB561_004329 [Smittium simulii]|uniref:2-amino-3-carboxymuconate-6-semialdehyde decarboxylase n=1 Tax=Smittium simulii TaxID=133385 RepID=A0A2T9YGX6_9FUNG|nr:hypothetical protein BB561_004329 [Smittium simulii]